METLKVEGLRTYFGVLRGQVKAVDGIDFAIQQGQAYGLAGESGCGKTTTALSILRLLPNNGRVIDGRILLEGKDILKASNAELRKDIRWRKLSVIFQGAMNSLNPIMQVGKQITEGIMLHEEIDSKAAMERAAKLLDLVGIGSQRLSRYPHELSGGLKQRTMIAMALSCNPSLVIADEPTTALDVIIAAQVLKVMKELQRKLRISMLVISHDLSMIADTCDAIGIMYAGKIVEKGDIKDVYKEPLHPYTQKLLGAFPSLLGNEGELESIPGFPPDLLHPPSGCRFHPRCPYAMETCKRDEPQPVETGNEHYVECHLVG
jgi:peptide/nickel transport system ATP-binding protein